MGKPSDFIQGTLDLLILKTLATEPKHGWAIAKRIQQVSDEVLQITQGSLYPALHRLEQQALIEAEWGQTETGREAKFYQLTKSGRAALRAETAQWERLSNAVGLVLREAMVVAGIGMALGALAAVLVSRPLAAFLVDGLSTYDPVAYAATTVTLAVVALAAGWIPAWRAARVDPMAVLRRD